MNIATLSPKFQVVIPKEVRNQLGLKAGQRVQFTTEGNQISLRPIPSAEEMLGVIKEWADTPFARGKDREL
jgi:AbrB family looped-hinge helix DNA binding protein